MLASLATQAPQPNSPFDLRPAGPLSGGAEVKMPRKPQVPHGAVAHPGIEQLGEAPERNLPETENLNRRVAECGQKN